MYGNPVKFGFFFFSLSSPVKRKKLETETFLSYLNVPLGPDDVATDTNHGIYDWLKD